MSKIFRVGDTVYLIHGEGVHDVEFNKSYKIVEINSVPFGTFIALEGTGVMTNYSHPYPNLLEYHFYNSDRFTSDIKPLRKKKLHKIYESIILETTVCEPDATR